MNDATRASTSNPKIARDRSPPGSRVHNETSTSSPGSSDGVNGLGDALSKSLFSEECHVSRRPLVT
jgi:hypothetical protein